MSSLYSPVQTAETHDIEPRMIDDVNSDISFSYTDDENSPRGSTSPNDMGTGVWSKEEHTKFLEAIKIYANRPWKFVAAYVGTRTVRQTMTHAQKYRQKAARRLRGLRTKQALMRMHFGHHVSEEYLMQERLRSMCAVRNNFELNCEPIPINFSFPEASVDRRIPDTRHFASEYEALVFPPIPEDPACLEATLIDVEEADLLEDLTAGPTLEECATELLRVLF